MIEPFVSLPLLGKAAPLLIPVAATLAKHCLGADKSLFNELLETLIDHAKDATTDKLEEALKQKPDAALALNQQVFMRYTGWVLGALIRQFAGKPQFEDSKADLERFAEQAPDGWLTFVQRGSPGLSPVQQDVFLRQMAASMAHDGTLPPVDSVPFITFINWHVRLPGAMQQKLDAYLKQHLDNALHVLLLDENKEAQQAYKQILLSGIHGIRASLQSLHQKMDVTVPLIVETHQTVKATQQENNLVLGQLLSAVTSNNAESRLAAYKRALLSAFRPYQELAIDNFAAAEQAAPDIWDIFVHPACSKEHLRPEDMDAAQRETPPRLPAQDLLPLLAQEDYRRTVLLADPGMGKSTLIQSLIANLASGRPVSGAPALTGLLPVPLILRDLVPLLPQDRVESWSWDDLITVLVEHYQRDETAPPLCDCFKGYCDEFRQLLHADAKVFFLIDGLDEIGDLAKRRQIVTCIREGIRAANKDARWLITSRVIGYDDASVDIARLSEQQQWLSEHQAEEISSSEWREGQHLSQKLINVWDPYAIPAGDQGFPFLCRTFKIRQDGSDLEADSLAESGFVIEPGLTSQTLLTGVYIAQRLHLASFDDQRQDSFTQRWFQHRHSTDYSKELMREVRAHHHDGVRIISRVPNLLCMMNILKRSGKPLPDGRAALYDAIVQAYLGGIDAAYRLRPVHGDLCPFDAAQRRFLLALLGAHMQQTRTMHQVCETGRTADLADAVVMLDQPSPQPPPALHPQAEGNILISRPEVEQLLGPAIQRLCDERRVMSDHSAAALLDELLHHIASRSGLLIPRSSDAEGNTLYGFTHLSFLEFFAAEWLGMEFDRQRNRLSRESEARLDGQYITEADLESEFPALGPIQHARESFKDLPGVPAWHEPLVFLLETRKADTLTLLRWLFPALHSSKPHVVSKDDPNATPLLPLAAVQLAVNLAQDPEIPLPATTRQSWWRILWSAYLAWPHTPREYSETVYWAIAPLLLGSATDHDEVLQALVATYPKEGGHPAPSTSPMLYLNECSHLTTQDLTHITQLVALEGLYLDDCTGLERLPDLHALQRLKELSLRRCTGLHGPEAFSALSTLAPLQELILCGCTGLERLPDLRALQRLRLLALNGCTGLHTPEALRDLKELTSLQRLDLGGCTKLERLPDLLALQRLQELSLSGCTGLQGPEALSGLSELASLEKLNLKNCTGLERLPDLRALLRLQFLSLINCNGLHGPQALSGLMELKSLNNLWLHGCTGITQSDVKALQEKLGKKCQIFWP